MLNSLVGLKVSVKLSNLNAQINGELLRHRRGYSVRVHGVDSSARIIFELEQVKKVESFPDTQFILIELN